MPVRARLALLLRVSRLPLLPAAGGAGHVLPLLAVPRILDWVDRVTAPLDPFVAAGHLTLGHPFLGVLPVLTAP